MRRGLWFVAGAGVGVYAMLRGRRAAEALTAEGLHDRWQALGLGARLFRDEVATGRAEAESRLRERFGPTYDAQRQLVGPSPAPSLEATGPGPTVADGHRNPDITHITDRRDEFEEGPP